MLLLARVLWKYHLMLTVIREEFATLSLLSFLISSAISIQSSVVCHSLCPISTFTSRPVVASRRTYRVSRSIFTKIYKAITVSPEQVSVYRCKIIASPSPGPPVSPLCRKEGIIIIHNILPYAYLFFSFLFTQRDERLL